MQAEREAQSDQGKWWISDFEYNYFTPCTVPENWETDESQEYTYRTMF
jgi:hypothetical protein